MKRSWKLMLAGLLLVGAFMSTTLWIMNQSEPVLSKTEQSDDIQTDQFLSVVP